MSGEGKVMGTRGGVRWFGAVVAAVLIVIALLSFAISSTTVQAGNVGVLLTFGRVEPGVLSPGFHLVVPVAQRIVQVSTRVSPHSFKSIDAASQELQSVKLTGTMNYHLEADRANELYQNVGLGFAESVIDPAFNDFIKEVVPRYQVTEILAKRDEIRSKAKEGLGANLQRYGIVVDDIYISDIAFSNEYQTAIERKQTAQQQVEAERQILAQREIQAQQAVVEAKGKADARVATADGESTANNLLTQSITPQLVDYLRWTKWDGKLPTVTGGGNTLFSLPLDQSSASPSPTAVPRP
jgi:regulator of protease activity HflC (stomatin/prohibitin superfamily)